MQVIIMAVALGGFISLFVNAGRKLYLWLGPVFPNASGAVFGILYGVAVAVAMVLFVLSRLPDSRVPRGIFLVAHYALGMAVFIMMSVNAADIVLFLARLCRLLPSPLPKGAAIAAGTAALALSAFFSVYGVVHASAIQTKNYRVELQGGGPGAAPMKIALISDIHLGYVIDEKHVAKIVAAVNAAEPDLVCIAGDIFDGDITSLKNPSAIQELFREFHAPYGVYACLGNHDAGAGYEGMLEFLGSAQVRVLQDEAVLIDGRMVLAGRKDSMPIGGQGKKRAALEDPMGAECLPRVVLDHNPGNIGEYNRSTDLILCGHTHRGQMFPFNLATRAMFEVDYGYYRRDQDSPQAIVTSGAGTWGPPQRVGTDNEVAVIQVEFPVPGGEGKCKVWY